MRRCATLGLPVIPWLSDPIGRWFRSSSPTSGKTRPSWCCCSRRPAVAAPGTAGGGLGGWGVGRGTRGLIILPLLRPVVMIALMLRVIDTFRTFDVVWLMTQGWPCGATSLITVDAYLLAFQSR